MVAAWYAEWVTRHATLFGMGSDADVKTLLSWEDVFTAAEYTVAELKAATDWLAANPAAFGSVEARYAGKAAAHLEAIQARIRETRAVVYRAESVTETDYGRCVLCGGTGRVIVPHVRGVKAGQWVPIAAARGGASYYTMAVLCSCVRGEWVRSRNAQHVAEKLDPKGLSVLTLARYEQMNPNWQVQMEQRKREQLAAAALRPASPEFAAVVDRLRKQYGLA